MGKKMLEPYSLAKEEGVRKFWANKKIAEKVKQQASQSRKNFFFMDGPPYATGSIHMGTALNKILKDVSIRQKRMQGFEVRDQPGYDTHGLPIEHKVEKELGIKNKDEIEKIGVDKFVKECEKFATKFIGVMNGEFDNLGVWMDWENPYLTLSNDYIEAIWWTFKKADEKGLLYRGNYPIHVCPRCGTAVAYNEIEYSKETDMSIYVKFPLEGGENRYLVIWTTTPWTLPGNLAVMVHPKFEYAEAELSNGEKWIVAEERLEQLMDAVEAGYKVVKVWKGKELEGLKYSNPLAEHMEIDAPADAYRVLLSDRYVNLEEGSGLVHCAPGHGREDYEVGSKAGLPAICPVGILGELDASAGKYEGKKAREVDAEIISDLEQDGYLVYKHPYTHDYPMCWRCKNPLLMVSTPQWFFRITKIRDTLLKRNEDIKWIPKYGQDRFRNWLESLGDWPVSRLRYWGAPLPIWVCEECEEKVVVGSLKDLSKYAKVPKDLDMHKPWIDEVSWKCKCGKGEMKRVPEVLDVWFDSGVGSWGSLGYPESEKLFKKFWPADLNIEGKDQIRGWWNSQLITSEICFDRKPFKAIMMHGIVTDVKKEGLSKSKGNYVAPDEVIKSQNRDYLRYFLVRESKGEDFAFDEKRWFEDAHRFFNVYFNVYKYVATYLNVGVREVDAKKLKVEDKWILSRLNSVVGKAVSDYNDYEYWRVLFDVNNFVLDELSRTYVKLVRGRVGTASEEEVEVTLNYVIDTLVRLLAPVTPHMSEYIYQHMKGKGGKESVHMLELPKKDKKLVDCKLEERVALAREIAQVVLSMREEEKLRLRWSLNSVRVKVKEEGMLGEASGILAKLCNVKEASEVKEKPKQGQYAEKVMKEYVVYLETGADAELREEWELAELLRRVQAKRKELKLRPQDRVELKLGCSADGFVEKYKACIEEGTNTKVKAASGKMERVLEKEFFLEVGKK